MFDLLNFLLKVLLSESLFGKRLIAPCPILTQLAVLRIQSLIFYLNRVEVFSDYFAGSLAPFC